VSDNVERSFETDTYIHTYVDTDCGVQAVSSKGGSFFCAVKQTEREAKQSSLSNTGIKNASR